MTSQTLSLPLRRTKIVATLGPASDRPGVLDAMLKAGVDVVRLNFSHGAADDHRRRLQEVREIAQRLGRSVAVLGDLQGLKFAFRAFRMAPSISPRASRSSSTWRSAPIKAARNGSAVTTNR